MSTQLRNATPDLSLTRFWGGKERGVCVQVTGLSNAMLGFEHIQLTRQEAGALGEELLKFAAGKEVEDLDGGL